MSTIKPIETHWRGYRFRSRLEARWAVAFDRMGFSWVYEAEGYRLPSGLYLPDFRFNHSGSNTWVEIKPYAFTVKEIDLCEQLNRATGDKVLMVAGEPRHGMYEVGVIGFSTTYDRAVWGFEWGEGRRCSKELWLISDYLGATCILPMEHSGDGKFPLAGESSLIVSNALRAATEARFEHGEKPS